MKNVNLSELVSVLDEAYKKGTKDRPYSILVLGDAGTGSKTIIREWMGEKNIPLGDNRYSVEYEKDDVTFVHYDTNIDEVFNHTSLLDLLNRKNHSILMYNFYGQSEIKQIKLIIVRQYLPDWYDGKSVIKKEDYHLFDEVVLVRMDRDLLKSYFISKLDDEIEFIKEDTELNEVKKNETLKKFKNTLNNGIKFLNSEKFHFISIELTSNPGFFGAFEHFTPRSFMQFAMLGCLEKEHIDIKEMNIERFGPKTQKMIKSVITEINKK